MKKLDRKKQMYIAVIFTVALLIGVGYAFLTSNLNITGNTNIKGNSWDVHFENFTPKSGSVTATSAGINTGGTAVNYTVTLQKPGDFYEFNVDAVNDGSIDAMISTVSNTGLTSAQARYMTYSVAYSDGTEVAQKQALSAGSSETFKVRVEYKKDITASDLPSTEQQITLTFSVQYVQADGSAVAVNHPICKRATALHSNRTVGSYGNLGTKGNSMGSGDAFDCDVNGDGTYDASTERFYYVAPLDTNSSYAVLVYYNNVSEGTPNITATFAYEANLSSGVSSSGPVTGKLQLPTTAQWKNVSLSSTTRNIKDETGAVKVSNFSYAGYAARFLTYQELIYACQGSLLDNCLYFKENIFNNYWLENISSTYTTYTWRIMSTGLNTTNAFEVGSNGVRPVIEVPMSKIDY